MTDELVLGDIIEIQRSSGELSFEWRISEFSRHSNASDWYTSPPFSFFNECWSLNVDFNVLTWGRPKCMELTLVRDKPGLPVTVNFAFAIKVLDGVVKKIEKEDKFSEDNLVYWFSEFCLMSELTNQPSELVPDDVLTITGSLKSDVPKISFPKRPGNVICSLKAILSEGRRSDFTLAVEDREWHVHKIILESRCEYFASMFRREWTENTESKARFDDIGQDVMNCVLQFIYTGEIEDVTVEDVCAIYVAAHRFLLEDLKPLCVQSMIKNMGTDIVCGAMAIAKMYEEKDLEESALDFLCQEAERIFSMHEWKQFELSHPSTAAEILKEIDDEWINIIKE